MTPESFRADLRESKTILEQVSGQPVIGFRAPSFSIVPGVEWAWEILAEEGFLYDSSVFPIRRPGYGNPGRPREPYTQQAGPHTLKQFPLATATFGGVPFPAAGGAYLRLLPLALVHAALRDAADRGVPAMCYIHPWEIDPDQPRLDVGPLTRLRHYGGLARVEGRLQQLFSTHRFTSVRQYLAGV
jgi:polysaccharide deacetylase family protein (PEP-CTERM system associated)